MKDENPEMMVVHYAFVYHRENLISKNISFFFKEVLKSISKSINTEVNAECERLFRQFCELNKRKKISDHVVRIYFTLK